jgi:hypothetical protein
MVIRYGYAEQVLSKELGQFVYTELQKYIVTELLPDGRSAAIVNPHGPPPVIDTMANRLKDRSKKGDSSYLESPDELRSSTASASGIDANSYDKPIDSESSSKITSANVLTKTSSMVIDGQKPPVVDMNERERRMKALEEAYKQQVLYIVGKTELLVPDKEGNFIRRFFLAVFLYLRDLTNERATSLRIPMDKLVEVGFIREL